MSSLFGIVNSIRPFSILLYTYTLFYNVLYFAILTRHFRLLWWCFALLICIWLCKVLYPIVQFYILLRRSSKIGWLSKFLYSVLRSHIVSSCESKLYYAYVISGMALSGKNSTTEQGNGYRSQPRSHFCHPLSKWRTMLIRRIDKKTRIGQGLKLS